MSTVERMSDRRFSPVERAWDFYARFYDVAQPFFIRLVGAFGDLSYDEFEEEFVEVAGMEPGQTVLDVACGTGAGHRALRDALGPEGRIVAVDISAEMLRRAKSRRRRSKNRNIVYRKVDAERLSRHFEEDSFDAVVSCNGLPNFLRPRQALIEMTRVLRPGGTLAVSTVNRDRCDDIPFWRYSMKFSRGRFLYAEEYREILRDLGLFRIRFHGRGLMLIITARKRPGGKPGARRTAAGRTRSGRKARAGTKSSRS